LSFGGFLWHNVNRVRGYCKGGQPGQRNVAGVAGSTPAGSSFFFIAFEVLLPANMPQYRQTRTPPFAFWRLFMV
jgi:hypothetical protein